MQTSSARSRYVESVLGYMSSSSMRRIFDGDFASRWLPSVYSTPENSPSSPLSVTRGGGLERNGLTPPILLHPKSGRGHRDQRERTARRRNVSRADLIACLHPKENASPRCHIIP